VRSKAAAKRAALANPWICMCMPQLGTAGRQWHVAACKRAIYAAAQKVGAPTVSPIISETVTCLQSAGPRAGRVYRCVRVHRDGWEEVGPGTYVGGS
jgi:hypothetical protein